MTRFFTDLLDSLRGLGQSLEPFDLAIILGYFAMVTGIGFWAARRVRDERDFFLGGRRFGKGLLVMHWLCTGTHSEMAVQVAGASARFGLGGIWYQWYMMFSTPFYWLIAPITRRSRVVTTGDLFRVRYGRSLELLYSLVALVYFALSIAMLLRGAGVAIAGATGDQVPTTSAVIALAVLFSTYVMAGGMVSAAYTDVLQGAMIVVLSVMLVPFGLSAIGGNEALHRALPAAMFWMTAPAGAPEGDPWWVVAMSLLGLVGIVAQPHVMSATGSGRTETEARVGMVYGNFIKRLLTIAWAFIGLIAIAHFPETLAPYGGGAASPDAKHASETLFGASVREFLPLGWRGLMIACLIAGVTSSETFMVVGAAIFTRNFFAPLAPSASSRSLLWVGRVASFGMLAASIALALAVESVTGLLQASIQWIGLLGPAVWLGVTWRRATAAGAWASFLGGLLTWGLTTVEANTWGRSPLFGALARVVFDLSEILSVRDFAPPARIALTLAVEFALLFVVSLLSRPRSASELNPFFARLYTPVGKENEVLLSADSEPLPESATLGMEGILLDYRQAEKWGYLWPRRFGFEIPRLSKSDWLGFLLAWILVGALIGFLAWLAR